ncbi:beta-glucuronosyltransferase GlcAT14C-like [Malus sylvestris]|uniref:beta-glucuronosyltransferase GlcAT14C-like n=1 Tax=Malus sylvestris TaxID=3752 RepID=UPI0021AD4E2E|nr:beta-glucuronosyltransferase GlcAT14C-like [Malus sylvestris]
MVLKLPPMRTPNTSSWCFGYRLWILALSVTLVLLGAISRSSHNVFSGYGNKNQHSMRVPLKGNSNPPIFAYWICGTKGESEKIFRLLKAIYHPRNHYLLQLDSGSSDYDRGQLALSVQSERVFRYFGNVYVVGKSYALNQMGSSALAATLNAAALLLKLSADWDWFITLSASDYPLMNQDDLLHAFTLLPRNTNFIHFTNKTGWKEHMDRIVDDPSLYLQHVAPLLYIVENRTMPDAFKIFGGSPWTILTRDFLNYCVKGWDNFPRKLLMYLSNVPYPLESYFHTIICSLPEFRNSLVNNDLRYIIWDTNALGEAQVLNISHYDQMLASGAAFARPFRADDDPVLNKIDESVLNRTSGGLVPGEWCPGIGRSKSLENSAAGQEELCPSWGNINHVTPGPRGVSLREFLPKLAVEGRFTISHCQEQ